MINYHKTLTPLLLSSVIACSALEATNELNGLHAHLQALSITAPKQDGPPALPNTPPPTRPNTPPPLPLTKPPALPKPIETKVAAAAEEETINFALTYDKREKTALIAAMAQALTAYFAVNTEPLAATIFDRFAELSKFAQDMQDGTSKDDLREGVAKVMGQLKLGGGKKLSNSELLKRATGTDDKRAAMKKKPEGPSQLALIDAFAQRVNAAVDYLKEKGVLASIDKAQS